MKKYVKNVVSLLLCAAMLCPMLASGVFAEFDGGSVVIDGDDGLSQPDSFGFPSAPSVTAGAGCISGTTSAMLFTDGQADWAQCSEGETAVQPGAYVVSYAGNQNPNLYTWVTVTEAAQSAQYAQILDNANPAQAFESAPQGEFSQTPENVPQGQAAEGVSDQKSEYGLYISGKPVNSGSKGEGWSFSSNGNSCTLSLNGGSITAGLIEDVGYAGIFYEGNIPLNIVTYYPTVISAPSAGVNTDAYGIVNCSDKDLFFSGDGTLTINAAATSDATCSNFGIFSRGNVTIEDDANVSVDLTRNPSKASSVGVWVEGKDTDKTLKVSGCLSAFSGYAAGVDANGNVSLSYSTGVSADIVSVEGENASLVACADENAFSSRGVVAKNYVGVSSGSFEPSGSTFGVEAPQLYASAGYVDAVSDRGTAVQANTVLSGTAEIVAWGVNAAFSSLPQFNDYHPYVTADGMPGGEIGSCYSRGSTTVMIQRGNEVQNVLVESISTTLEPQSITCAANESKSFVVTLNPDNPTDSGLAFAYDPSIISVSQNGGIVYVNALNPGITEIVITSNDGNARTIIPVEVVQPQPQSVPVTAMSMYYNGDWNAPSSGCDYVFDGESKSYQLFAVVNQDATDPTVTWSTSDPSVASVVPGNSGTPSVNYAELTVNGAGSATITATSSSNSEVYATFNVLVTQKQAEPQMIAPSYIVVTGQDNQEITSKTLELENFEEPRTLVLHASVFPESASDRSVTWSSTSNSLVQLVPDSADPNTVTLQLIGYGEFEVVATAKTAEGFEAPACRCSFKVVETPKTEVKPTGVTIVDENGIQVTSVELDAIPDGELSLTAVVAPENAANKTVIWGTDPSSQVVKLTREEGNTVYFTVTGNGTGKISVYAAGNANATPGECIVTVNVPQVINVTDMCIYNPDWLPVDRLEYSYTGEQTDVGTIYVVLAPENATDLTVTWKSSNENVIKVEELTPTYDHVRPAKLTVCGAGSAEITALANDGSEKSAKCAVEVAENLIVKAETVILSDDTLSLVKGQEKNVTANVLPVEANTNLDFVSNNPDVASIQRAEDGSYLIEAKEVGLASVSFKTTDGSDITKTLTIQVAAPEVPVTGITLKVLKNNVFEAASAETITGLSDSLLLFAQIAPAEASDKEVNWSINGDDIVSIESEVNGWAAVKPLKEGTATVTATAGGVTSGSFAVTVTIPIEYDYEMIEAESETEWTKGSEAGMTVTFDAPFEKFSSAMIDGQTIPTDKYEVKKGSTIIILDSAFLESLSPGAHTLTLVFSDGKTASVVIVITKPTVPVTGINASPEKTSVETGKSISAGVTIFPDNATNKKFTAKSSNTGIATVPSGELDAASTFSITGVAKGTATITVTSVDNPAMSFPFEILVTDAKIAVKGISAVPKDTTVYASGKTTAAVSFNPADATDKSYTVTSSNTGVVSVPSGIQTADTFEISGVAKGTATVTVKSTDGSYESKFDINVASNAGLITDITVNKTGLSLYTNQQGSLKISITPSTATENILVRSESNTVAKVTAGSSKDEVVITGLAAGSTYINISSASGNVVRRIPVTVASGTPVTSITMYNSKWVQATNETINGRLNTTTLYAFVNPTTAANTEVEWVSSNPYVAYPTPASANATYPYVKTATITAYGTGTAVITAMAKDGSGIKAQCAVTVTNASNYSVTYMDNSGTWFYDYPTDFKLICNGPRQSFYALAIDGVPVNSAYYSVVEGSTVITLSRAYLGTLAKGKHTGTIYYNNGSVYVPFQLRIQSVKDPPRTGDDGFGYAPLTAALSLMAIAASVAVHRRKEHGKA